MHAGVGKPCNDKADLWKLMFKVILHSLKGGECVMCVCL